MTTDNFFKVNPLIQTFNATFRSAYELGRHIAFDEATIKATGKRVPGKMFNPMKPHKWGIKLFMTCCGDSGYCYKFEVYKGKKSAHSKEANMSTGPAAIIRNMKEFAHTKRIVYCDRFYTSISCFIQLLFLGIYACGTILVNRKGFSPYLKMEKSSNIKRGTLRQGTCKIGDLGTICGIAWCDTKPVHMISTGIHSNQCVIKRKGKNGEIQKVHSSNIVAQYTKYMGGVDLHDYLRMARYRVQTSCVHKKWYKLFFLAMIDICLVNAFLLWKNVKANAPGSSKDHAWFQEQVANDLLNTTFGSIKTRSFSPFKISKPIKQNECSVSKHKLARYDEGDGYAGREKRYRRCFVCGCYGIRTMSEYYCVECKVCICTKVNTIGNLCWVDLHTSNDIKDKYNKRILRLENSSQDTKNKDPINLTPRGKRKRHRDYTKSNNVTCSTPTKKESSSSKGKKACVTTQVV